MIEAAGQRHQVVEIRDVEVADPQFLIRLVFRRSRKPSRVSAQRHLLVRQGQQVQIDPVVFKLLEAARQACTVPSRVAWRCGHTLVTRKTSSRRLVIALADEHPHPQFA